MSVVAAGFTPSGLARDRRTPQLATRWVDAGTALIVVEGELDAANAGAIVAAAGSALPRARRLVVDLSRLEFFGIEGFSALEQIVANCRADGAQWVLVPGPAVARVLRICDPQATLSTAGTVCSAFTMLRGQRRALSLVDR